MAPTHRGPHKAQLPIKFSPCSSPSPSLPLCLCTMVEFLSDPRSIP
uniref:Uncharacterized protein n=1 Tax=Arundo donax TaxID=35708 RepID=A0A0A9ES96_ARUDO